MTKKIFSHYPPTFSFFIVELDNIAQFPTLNENQIKKLKHLSIATLSETSQVYNILICLHMFR